MGRDPAKDAMQTAETRQRLLEAGLRLFSERAIEQVSMTDVAEAAGVGVATLYRYFSTKPLLVLAVSIWSWEVYTAEALRVQTGEGRTAAEEFAEYLDSFVDLYRNHKDILRFNHFFNVYVQSEALSGEMIETFNSMIAPLESRFRRTCVKAEEDGTLRTDVKPEALFACTLHLMLAAVTRYAVGLVYNKGDGPEREILLLRDMLLREFVSA